MIKKCAICNQEFETIKYGGARKYCFDCSPRVITNDNKERAASITTIRHAIKKQLVKYKGGKCECCGYDRCIGALQFHHTNQEEKEFDLCNRYNGGSVNMEALYAEADKCQLLCANCHAEKHFYTT